MKTHRREIEIGCDGKPGSRAGELFYTDSRHQIGAGSATEGGVVAEGGNVTD
jgi:hypothetical protein